MTKQFGVPLMISGSFVKLLSAQVRARCRKLVRTTLPHGLTLCEHCPPQTALLVGRRTR